MKKKVLAIFSAVAVLALAAMPAFAANSVSAEDIKADKSVVAALDDTPSISDAKVATEGFTSQAATTDDIKAATSNALLKEAALETGVTKAGEANADKEIIAEVLAALDIEPAAGAVGPFVFDVTLNGVSASDKIAAIHIKDDGSKEVVDCVAGANKVTVTADSCSPFIFVKLTAKSNAVPAPAAAATTSSTAATTATAAPVSPKTGEAIALALVFAVAGIAGAVVCGKKFFA